MFDFRFDQEEPQQRRYERTDSAGRRVVLRPEGQPAGRGAGVVLGLAGFFTLGLLVLGGRLYQLQVRDYQRYAVQASSNVQREVTLPAVRGEILTRDGVVLATSRPVTDLVYLGKRPGSGTGASLQAAAPDWKRIQALAGILPSALPGGQPREPDPRKETEVVLARSIPPEKVSALAEYLVMVPSLQLRQRTERVYPQGQLAAHLVGYVQEASAQQVNNGEYELGDSVGQSGIEASLQNVLAGKNGLQRREVSASGRSLNETVIQEAQRGQKVVLTIDSGLQRAAEKALQEGLADINEGRKHYGKPAETVSRGAILAVDPRTGEVLAMASSPTYDPNWFSQTPSPNPERRNWAIDPTRPGAALDAVTSNRTVQTYNPGSVFKPATALMFLERWGNFSRSCTPSFYFAGARFNNWASFNLGVVDARRAIAYSCNPWFYASAVRGGPAEYSRQLKKRLTELGYAGPTGLQLVGEKTGQLWDIQDYDQKTEAGWSPGFALNMSIGQGDTLVSPAQQAYVLATIINEGRQRPLTLVRQVGAQVQPLRPPRNVATHGKAAFQTVKEGMELTTTLRLGTSSFVLGPRLFPVRTAGKTGTAENGLSYRQGYAYTHAWYEGYGPVENPNFLVVTFFQNGGEGSGPALKAAQKMFAARWCLNPAEPMQEQKPCLGELKR